MLDLLVIGGGMAGAVAAATAVGRGARVALASRAWGATALSNGALDIAHAPALSRSMQVPSSVAEHVMDIVAHRRQHPFARLGLEKTVQGIQYGFETLRQLLDGSGLQPPKLDLEDENIYLPSALGMARPAASALRPHLGLDLGQHISGGVGVLQFLGQKDFDARAVADGLRADLARISDDVPEMVVIPVGIASDDAPLSQARRLDDQSCLDRLARNLSGKGKNLAAIIAPPVLGLDHHAVARERLSQAAECPVVEALAHLPSVPGVRLQRALDAALEKLGVKNVGDVVSARTEQRHVLSVTTRDQLEITAGAFVLATGRFVSGGVEWKASCREALFDLPVVTKEGVLEEDSPHQVVRDNPVETQPVMAAGVPVDAALRPMREGRVAFDNLFAAGMIIGGFSSRFVWCSDGVAVATGALAGSSAGAAGGSET